MPSSQCTALSFLALVVASYSLPLLSESVEIASATSYPYPSYPGWQSTTISSPLSTVPTTTSSSTPAVPTATVFNAQANDNVAVYYGQVASTSNVTLTTICTDPNVNIVILAFVDGLFASGGWPSLNLGNNCAVANTAQQSFGAADLEDCVVTDFANEVSQCQTLGKKVLLSLGGATGASEMVIPSEAAAQTVAETLWDLFLGGQDETSIRPFGDVVLDGIDIDNENNDGQYFDALILSLRNLFTANNNRDYYLSAAPQCPPYGITIPLNSLQTEVDFVWVQFYNNPGCDFSTQAGFEMSLQYWSDLLSPGTTVDGVLNNNTGSGIVPKLYVGASATSSIFSGYVDVANYADTLSSSRSLNVSNVGGAMFWDGVWGEESADESGETFMQAAKAVLG